MISTVKMRFGSDIIHIRGNRKPSKALANNLKVVSLNAIGCSFGTQTTRTYKFCFFFPLSLSFFVILYNRWQEKTFIPHLLTRGRENECICEQMSSKYRK